jgi:hypothetical protein
MKKYIVILSVLSLFIMPSVSSATSVPDEDVDPNPTSTSCISLNNNLRYRSRDATTNGEVSSLQDFLQAQGYLNSEPTGYFGLLTFKAVKSFQSSNGINPTGYVGPITRAKINSMCGTTVIETSHLPPGCFTDRGYSTTTGKKCDGSTTNTESSRLIITTPEQLPGAKVGEKYSIKLSATGGDGTYIWGLKGDPASFPVTGLGFSASGGTYISGIPAKLYKNGTRVSKMTFDFVLYVTSGSQKAYKEFTMTVVDPEFWDFYPFGCASYSGYSATTGEACDGSTPASNFTITTASTLPNTKVGSQYQAVLNVYPSSLSTNQLYWSVVAGKLPPGLFLSASDLGKIITGSPTISGTYTFNLQASITNPSTAAQTTNKQFTLTVEPQEFVAMCDYAAPPIGCSYVNGPNFDPTTQCGMILSCTNNIGSDSGF